MSEAAFCRTNTKPKDKPRNAGAVYGVFLAASAGLTVVAPILPVLQHLYGLGPAAAAWILVMPSVSMLLASSHIGRLGDRFGSGRAASVAAILIAASLLLSAIPSIEVLIAARLVFGLGNAAMWTVGLTYLGAGGSSNSAKRVAGAMTATALGAAAGPALSGIPTERFGYGAGFIAIGSFATIFALMLGFAALSKGGDRMSLDGRCPVVIERSRFSIWSTLAVGVRRPVVVAGASTLALSGVVVILLQLLVPVQLSAAGHSTQTIGLVLSAGSLVFVGATALCLRIGPQLTRLRSNALCCAVLAASLIPAVVSSDIAWVAAVVMLSVLPRAVIATVGYALATSEHDPGGPGRGAILGSVNSTMALAMILAPLLVGLSLEWTEPQWIYTFVAVSIGAAAGVLYRQARRVGIPVAPRIAASNYKPEPEGSNE